MGPLGSVVYVSRVEIKSIPIDGRDELLYKSQKMFFDSLPLFVRVDNDTGHDNIRRVGRLGYSGFIQIDESHEPIPEKFAPAKGA